MNRHLTRRDCLAHMAAATALAAALPRLTFGADAPAKPKERVKIGQLGIGHNHGAAKMETFRKLKDDYEVVGVVEPDPKWRKKREKEKAYKEVPWLTEEELFAVKGLKAVAVETDVPDLTATALRCVKAGLHVHVDKPGDESYKAFSALLDEAGKRGLAVQMAYMFRGNPAMQFCFKAVREGLLGRVHTIAADMSRYQSPEYHTWLSQFHGGNFYIFSCHLIDLIVTLMGEPERIAPFMRQTYPEKKTVDSGVAVLEYPRALVTVRSAALEVEGEKRRHLVISGDKGTIELRPLEEPATVLRLTLKEDSGAYRKGTQTVDFPKMGGRYDNQLSEFARIVRGEIPNPYPLEHERLVQKCVLLASGVPLDS
jgi:predicted dehydrogenase